MVQYNPKDWFSFIFRFHKSDTFRQLLPLIIAIALYAAGVAYLEVNVLKLSQDNHLKNLPVMHGILSFVISMLLVFRTNTAYDRWWEGRKLWGALVNSSRNLALKLAALVPADNNKDREFFKKIIPAYAFALKHHLMNKKLETELFDDHPELYRSIDKSKHIPNQVAALLTKKIYTLHKEGIINGHELYTLNAELQSFTDICGACERIKNTPIPFSYSIFLKKFIFIYVMTLPLGYVFSLGYYAVPVVAFIFYVLASLELIAEEIEDPFGGDANDLPMERMAQNIHKHVFEIFE
jgi:ion channel-forming bestrophin family protein